MKRALIVIAILLTGLTLLIYPAVSNRVADKNGSYVIQALRQSVEETDDEALSDERRLAETYNRSLTGVGISDPFVAGTGVVLPDNYNEILDFANHVMASIEIPRIQVNLPVYHGTGEEALTKGVGHMPETAFPIGETGCHAVLTGHTGLAAAKLFTDLIELAPGDVFYIHILGDTLCYTVDQILVVEPDETDALLPEAGKDYVTLLTCTPYAVNTHRLLVRGVRTAYVPEERAEIANAVPVASSTNDSRILLYAWIAAGVMLLSIGAAWIYKRKQRARKRLARKAARNAARRSADET